MSKPGKRPMRSLTANEKLEAIKRVHEGESKASVARDIGVPESTLRGWCKNEDKISYLSRQSSPEADESTSGIEPKEKKIKLEETLQPYNLTKKSNGVATISPNTDYTNGTKPLNLNTKSGSFKTCTGYISDKNKAELARLGSDYNLDQPETFIPNVSSTSNGLTDLTNQLLTAQWNALLLQQKAQNNYKPLSDTCHNTLGNYTTQSRTENGHKYKHHKSVPKINDRQSILDEHLMSWFKTQSMLGLLQNQNGLLTTAPVTTTNSISTTSPNFSNISSTTTSAYNTPPSTTSNVTNTPNVYTDLQNNFKFWQWYKNEADLYGLQHSQSLQEKPILYQQLTKTKDGDGMETIPNENEPKEKNYDVKEGRNLLDDLLRINNNNHLTSDQDQNDVKEEFVSQNEGLMHGEKFLKYLESCREPMVTQLHILQLRGLLNNIRSSGDKKNCDLKNKCKVKRK